MPFQISLTGRLIDPVGVPLSGARVWFTSKATTRGVENVPQSADAFFSADNYGYYSGSVATGWYKVYIQESGALAPTKTGVCTVSGFDTLDIGTLIANSIQPTSQLEHISDVNVTGRVDGSFLEWSAGKRKWIASPHRTEETLFYNTAATGTVSGGFCDLMTQVIPGGTLANNGERLKVTAQFTAANGESNVRGYLGSTLVYDVTAWNTHARPMSVFSEIVITRTTATSGNVYSRTTHDDYSPAPYNNAPAFTGTALALASPFTLKFTASGAAAGNVTQNEQFVGFIPAP